MQENTAMRLKQLMRERNLRQVDVLKLAEPYCKQFGLKLTKSDMSQFLSGKVVPGQWKLSLLGRALNVSEAWLMGYDVPFSIWPVVVSVTVAIVVGLASGVMPAMKAAKLNPIDSLRYE